MEEIGGYFELERNYLPMLHEGAIALNSGGNCLAYLIRARKIRKIWLPYMLCDSVEQVCLREKIQVHKYHIDHDFLPVDVELGADEWLYVVNLYGQLSDTVILNLKKTYSRIIVDQAHAYFMPPLPGIDMIYICWKYFGVPDGAFLYTSCKLAQPLEQGQSLDRMRRLLGRFERTASEFYDNYLMDSAQIAREEVKAMSKLTLNLLHGIDYPRARAVRTENFRCLAQHLDHYNELRLMHSEGPFVYPFLVRNGSSLKKALIKEKIYIPTLWPNVLREVNIDTFEYDLACNTVLLPVDQRYGKNEMEFIVQQVFDSGII